MSDGFFYVRDTRTGGRFRCVAKPWMGVNSPYELMTKEEFYGQKPKPEPEKKQSALPVDNDDLTAGVDDGEEDQ